MIMLTNEAHAQAFQNGINNVVNNTSLGLNNFGGDPLSLLLTIIGLALTFVAVIAAAVLIYGGFLYISSQGDESRAAQAKKLILYAIIGLLVIGAAGFVVNFIFGIILA